MAVAAVDMDVREPGIVISKTRRRRVSPGSPLSSSEAVGTISPFVSPPRTRRRPSGAAGCFPDAAQRGDVIASSGLCTRVACVAKGSVAYSTKYVSVCQFMKEKRRREQNQTGFIIANCPERASRNCHPAAALAQTSDVSALDGARWGKPQPGRWDSPVCRLLQIIWNCLADLETCTIVGGLGSHDFACHHRPDKVKRYLRSGHRLPQECEQAGAQPWQPQCTRAGADAHRPLATVRAAQACARRGLGSSSWSVPPFPP